MKFASLEKCATPGCPARAEPQKLRDGICHWCRDGGRFRPSKAGRHVTLPLSPTRRSAGG